MTRDSLKYVPLALFCLSAGKFLFFQANWETAAVSAVIGAIAYLYEWKAQSQKIKDFEQRLEVITTIMNNHAKAYEELKSHLTSLKMAQGIRTSTPASATSTPIQKIF